ncbi:MAG: ferrous iron transport protein A [Scytolyngbya sp. HA4215-MV1]|jgi:ferrous iron transport protein A|nr:ferrous iron transport protein A [Scytolyngbya sp. HA4215-MV1]
MFTQKFTTLLSPLKLMRTGERGVVVRLSQSSDSIQQKLTTIGVTLGSHITLEQRFPRYIVWIDGDRIALNEDLLSAVYVRVVDQSC